MKYNADITYEFADDNDLLKFSISGYVSPFIPARLGGLPEQCYPAEGGELEDYTVRLLGGTLFSEQGSMEVTSLSPTHQKQLLERFETLLETDHALYERVRNLMVEDANDRRNDHE